MITDKHFKDIVTITLIIILFVLAALILKPIFIAILFGILLAYIFYPAYKFLLKYIKNKTLATSIICLILSIIIILPIYFFTGTLINQIVNLYLTLQKLDIYSIVRQILPSVINSSDIASVSASSLNSITPKLMSYIISKISSIALDLPIILLNFFVFIFIFFFALRDGDEIVNYIKSTSIIPKEIEDKFLKQFKDITYSVLYGQIVIGIIQGLVAGIGYFIFGVSNALLLTVLTMIMATLPMIGAWLVWVPVDIYLFALGRTNDGVGLLIYSLIAVSLIDNIIRTIIVSKRTKMNSGIVMVGMIGGFLVFGILGFILGPLILSYVILVIELYRKKKVDESIFIKEAPKP